MAAGKGSHIFDVDGNERIDFNNTTPILGHSHPRVLEAVREELGRGTVLGAPSEVELKLAEEPPWKVEGGRHDQVHSLRDRG